MLLTTLAIAVSSCKVQPVCTHPLPPPAYGEAHVTDDWLGVTEADTVLYRCLLRTNRTGVLMAVYADDDLVVYEISNWNLRTNRLTCEFRTPEGQFEPKKMLCTVKKQHIFATLYGKGGWRDEIVFRRASRFENKLSKLFQAPSKVEPTHDQPSR